MTRIPNPVVGTVRCPMCGDVATVKQQVKGQPLLYYVGKAGIITPRTVDGQAWINTHMQAANDDVYAPEHDEKAVGHDAPPPEAMSPPVRRKSLLDRIFEDDDE